MASVLRPGNTRYSLNTATTAKSRKTDIKWQLRHNSDACHGDECIMRGNALQLLHSSMYTPSMAVDGGTVQQAQAIWNSVAPIQVVATAKAQLAQA